METILASALPERSRWMVDGTSVDFTFTVARQGFQSLPGDVLKFDEDGTWSKLFMFGEYDVSEGGGARPFLCVRQSDGWVCGLDLERKDTMFPLNSSVDMFVATFQLLDSHLAHGQSLPPDCGARLLAIDPELPPQSDWFMLAEVFSSSRP